jgi:ribosomal protein S24E
MELHTIKEKDMKLLSRKRVVLMLDSGGATPSRKQLIKELAKKYKVSEEVVVIRHVYPQFGSKNAKLIVHIYDDKEKKAMFEHQNLLKKHAPEAKPAEAEPAKPAEAKPAEAKPAEAKPAEAKPAEAKPAEAKPAEPTESKKG